MTREDIIKAIEEMTVTELSQLVKDIEEKFDVKAQAPMAMAVAPAAGGAAAGAEEEKTDFKVMLTSFGQKKIAVIKVVREITGLGLKEAKELVDNAGSDTAIIKEAAPKDEAEDIKAKLAEAGAEVELK
ncbi:MAG TPA: 50S ribosomal protein L7/L12 [Thermotogota bacterium]|nr:50S ribosomal protein L7/L12 [Thermotogota bacterium]HPJ88257.1 50S ribosomal protein L7/L12 [Thermotogota bacterium]HPR96733.1 50S ribosomal protein L7/L12 [Thermotogota bacterium]